MKGLATVAVVQMTSLHLVEIWGSYELPNINGALDAMHAVEGIE